MVEIPKGSAIMFINFKCKMAMTMQNGNDGDQYGSS
jgi:hypothetical protein